MRRFLKRHIKKNLVVGGSYIVAAVILSLAIIYSMTLSGYWHREATLILAFENNGRGRIFTGEVVSNMTVLDALIVSSEAGQIELKYVVNSDNQAKIIGLNSYTDDLKKKHLIFYLNNTEINEGSINQTKIKPGDTIEIQLQ